MLEELMIQLAASDKQFRKTQLENKKLREELSRVQERKAWSRLSEESTQQSTGAHRDEADKVARLIETKRLIEASKAWGRIGYTPVYADTNKNNEAMRAILKIKDQ